MHNWVTTETNAVFRDEASDEQRRARQSAMMATTKQVTNKDERGVPRTTVANIMAMWLFQSHPRHPIALASDVDLALTPKTSNHIANRGISLVDIALPLLSHTAVRPV